ncbi:MAG TPA: DUF3800 domain-containing protein [Solirubrobacteraceae bacterium]|nr:DUF3800 domain-containing protein [Solirubrobacteraceae bacterium]
MYLAYVDESGDDGPLGSKSYALGCVMVADASWADAFDGLIAYRRFLRARFGIPVRAELKANYLIGNRGPHLSANPLPTGMRHAIYRGHMRLQPKFNLTTFAVVVDKTRANAKFAGARAASDIAWEYLLQRLERRSTKEHTQILLVHDEGDAPAVRARARKARRAGSAGSAFGTGLRLVPFRRLLDDPVPRHSHESYFLQLADLSAYAAFRRVYPPPARTGQVVPQTMWDELGVARFLPVRRGSSGPLAIVQGP